MAGLALVASGCAAGAAAPAASADTPLLHSASLAGGLLGPITGGLSTLNPVSAGASALAGFALSRLSSWVLDGTTAALKMTASVVDRVTAPRLESTWFSSTYWRVAGLAALLTLPFLFAAAAQALLRSDLALLGRAALGYLPVAVLGVSLAAPLAMLLLAATDQMSAVVAGSSGGGAGFLRQTAAALTGVDTLNGSPFLAFVVGLLTLAAAIVLAIEMLVREAAVYVVLLMLPLAFAALVWPARRVWATRLLELLVALILSKFVIVAVLSLAAAAFGGPGGAAGATRLITAMALLMLSTFAPWAMLRLLPFTEVAASAVGALRSELPRARIPRALRPADDGGAGWTESLPARMQRHGEGAEADGAGEAAILAATGSASRNGAQEWDRGNEIAGPQGDGDGAHSESPVAFGSRVDGGGPGGDRTPAGTTHDSRPPMDPIWRAENGAWPPMVLGLGGWGGPVDYEPPPPADSEPRPPADSEPPPPADHEPPTPPAPDDPDGRL